VLGIGLNVAVGRDEFPAELRDVATSLRVAGSAVETPTDALRTLVPVLDTWLAASPEAVLAAWRPRDALRGRPISWADGSGVAAGIDDEGSLLVETPGGVQALRAGEVHLTRS
jgi:BirA family biotin operon repressor/biotin-[acetyl-CoA-carboxylase] ligase